MSTDEQPQIAVDEREPADLRAKGKMPGWLVIGCIVLLVLGCIVVFLPLGISQHLSRKAQGKAAFSRMFDPYIEQYIADFPRDKSVNNYVRGKAIVIDTVDKSVHDLYYRLPPELQAHSPEEVTTVIRITRDFERLGVYTTDGKPIGEMSAAGAPSAYQETDILTIVDLGRGVLVAETRFVGDPPPQTSTSDSLFGEYGKPPDVELLVQWINSLKHVQ